MIHGGYKVDRKIRIITGGLLEQPPFSRKTMIKLCVRQGVQQTDHGRHNRGFLDKVYHPFKNSGGIVIESQDEPSLDLQAESLHLPYAGYQITIPVG